MAFDPELYSLIHRGNPGDVSFYCRQCAGVETVLELGCGDGRISLALARQGQTVVGLDIHQGMLDRLAASRSSLSPTEQNRLSWVRADMREFTLGQRFDRVIIPYNSLLCLLSDADVVQCLTTAAWHLNPDGTLVFDIYHVPFLDSDGEDAGASEECLTRVDEAQRTITVFERDLPHPDPRRCDMCYRYRIDSDDGSNETTITIEQRCLLLEEIPSLVAAAGLTVQSIRGDFADTGITEETTQLVICATHPTETRC